MDRVEGRCSRHVSQTLKVLASALWRVFRPHYKPLFSDASCTGLRDRTVNNRMQPGHVSLPNGQGLLNEDESATTQVGVAPNELTALSDRDPFAGPPWHKFVPARLEAL